MIRAIMLTSLYSREPLENQAATRTLIEGVRNKFTEALREYLSNIFERSEDVKDCLDQIIACWPSDLRDPLEVKGARGEAWVALNLVLNLPEYVTGQGKDVPVRGNRKLIEHLTQEHLEELGFMLFWNKSGQDQRVLDFLTRHPFGLKILPQSFINSVVALLLTQNPEPITQAISSGSEEIELPANSIILLTPESPIKRVSCPCNPGALTLVVKLNVDQPLVFVGHFSRGKDERGTNQDEGVTGAERKRNIKRLTLNDLRSTIVNAFRWFGTAAIGEDRPVSVEIYSANSGDLVDLARKFQLSLESLKLRGVKFSHIQIELENFETLELINQQGDLAVVPKNQGQGQKLTPAKRSKRRRKP
jgi:hypothetical protein